MICACRKSAYPHHFMRPPGMRPTPLVSIVTPVFNSRAIIGPTVECVLSQTYRKFEWIMVDDRSDDDTVEFLLGLGDPRIRVIQLDTNVGPAAARNTGMREAVGEYVTVIDHDDRWFPERLERCVTALSNDESVDFVSTDMLNGNPDEPESARSLLENPECWNRPLDRIESWIAGPPMPFSGSSFVVRREVLTTAGYYDDSLWAVHDWELMLRFRLAGFRPLMIPEVLGWTVIRDGQASLRHTDRNYGDRMRVLEPLTGHEDPAVVRAARDVISSHSQEEAGRLFQEARESLPLRAAARGKAVGVISRGWRTTTRVRWLVLGGSVLVAPRLSGRVWSAYFR